ncbi:hypothetical protein [Streptosporangium sp. NPDC002524]
MTTTATATKIHACAGTGTVTAAATATKIHAFARPGTGAVTARRPG